MPANVVMSADRQVVGAGHDHRARTEGDGHEVAGFGDLRFGGDEDPLLGEDLVEIEVEPLLMGVALADEALAWDA